MQSRHWNFQHYWKISSAGMNKETIKQQKINWQENGLDRTRTHLVGGVSLEETMPKRVTPCFSAWLEEWFEHAMPENDLIVRSQLLLDQFLAGLLGSVCRQPHAIGEIKGDWGEGEKKCLVSVCRSTLIFKNSCNWETVSLIDISVCETAVFLHAKMLATNHAVFGRWQGSNENLQESSTRLCIPVWNGSQLCHFP